MNFNPAYIPVRLCCFQRHLGPVCPDGKVICCLCFNRFEISELNHTDGKPEDVCKHCAELERKTINEHNREIEVKE